MATGVSDRLDFTVIGPAVNLTNRIGRLCRELDRNLDERHPAATFARSLRFSTLSLPT